jgi:hypothetical protein
MMDFAAPAKVAAVDDSFANGFDISAEGVMVAGDATREDLAT